MVNELFWRLEVYIPNIGWDDAMDVCKREHIKKLLIPCAEAWMEYNHKTRIQTFKCINTSFPKKTEVKND